MPPPGSGIILAFILNIMENYNVTKLDANDPLMHNRLVEAFKYGYAYRSKIGDPSDSNITKLVENVSLLHFVAFFPVASLLSKGVDNEKVGLGVDNEKALELDNRIFFSYFSLI